MRTITREFLRSHQDTHIFVFGDNAIRKGLGGAAALRDEPNSYGFITKKYPDNRDSSFYRPEEYKYVFNGEMRDLIRFVWDNQDKVIMISKIGSGLANKYNIWEEVIEPDLHRLERFNNVQFLWLLED